MTEIRTFDDFIEYLDRNYDNLTDHQYMHLCEQCLKVFENGKPKDKEFAINRIKMFWNKYGSKFEIPLFMDLDIDLK